VKTVQLLEWQDLTDEQRSLLMEKQVNIQVKWMIEIGLEPDHPLYFNLELAVNLSEKMHTPWFVGGYIMDDPELKVEVYEIAEAFLDEALYSNLDITILDVEL